MDASAISEPVRTKIYAEINVKVINYMSFTMEWTLKVASFEDFKRQSKYISI
jgi:hypothetical protein